MEDLLIKFLIETGIGAAMAGACLYILREQMKSHRKERQEFIGALNKQADEQRMQDKEQNAALVNQLEKQQEQYISIVTSSAEQRSEISAKLDQLVAK